MAIIKDEDRYKILKSLANNSNMNQRQLANELGVSLGKVNYCLKALIKRGLIKAGNCKRTPNKGAYVYLLTPKGIEEKARVTMRFLKRKQDEYEALYKELEELRQEAEKIRYDKKYKGEYI